MQKIAISWPSPLKHGCKIRVKYEFLNGIPVLHLSTAIILTMFEKLLNDGLIALAELFPLTDCRLDWCIRSLPAKSTKLQMAEY